MTINGLRFIRCNLFCLKILMNIETATAVYGGK